MKTVTKILSGVVLASAAAIAAATPITFDTVLVNKEVTNTSPQDFSFDLTDDTLAQYQVNTAISSAELHLKLTDPAVPGVTDTNEVIKVFFGDNPLAALIRGSIGPNSETMLTIALDSTAIADLKFDGKLTVHLTADKQGQNDVVANYFANDAYLTVTLDGGSSQGKVPEPASLGLFGITLAGLAAVRRRKQK